MTFDEALAAAETAHTAVVLCRNVDATLGPVEVAVIARDAEIKDEHLVLGTGVTLAEATAKPVANGIIVRQTI